MKKPRGMSGQVAKAVADLRAKLAKVDPEKDPIEHQRLTELIRMSKGDGEVGDDPMNQGERVKPAAKPRKF